VLTRDWLEVREPGPGELRIRVVAAGLNRADLIQRRGHYPAPAGVPADVPGLEYAGVVERIGSDVQDAREGDRVMGIVGGGAMAGHLVVSAREVIPIPERLSFEQAAGIPEAFLTAYDALVVQAGLSMGQLALVHAAPSGVGTAALQLIRRAGASSVGTSRSPDKLQRCRGFGLDHALVVEQGTFVQPLKDNVGRAPDVVLDLVGGAYLEDNLKAVAPRGWIVVVGLMGGLEGKLSMGRLLAKRVHLVGTVMRSRPPEEKASLAQRFVRDVVPELAAGHLEPVVDEVLPMDQVREAHERMEANRTFGKLVLRWPDDQPPEFRRR
jgi:putative PIG3 family NAD(P)H quinone oxidoreductase